MNLALMKEVVVRIGKGKAEWSVTQEVNGDLTLRRKGQRRTIKRRDLKDTELVVVKSESRRTWVKQNPPGQLNRAQRRGRKW